MAKYILTKPHFIGNRYIEAGVEYETDDPPSLGMEGVDDGAKAKCKERDDKRRASIDQAVGTGKMSRMVAENLSPKPEPIPESDEEDDDEPHKPGRRPTRR
jgi:hypothetical protein